MLCYTLLPNSRLLTSRLPNLFVKPTDSREFGEGGLRGRVLPIFPQPNILLIYPKTFISWSQKAKRLPA